MKNPLLPPALVISFLSCEKKELTTFGQEVTPNEVIETCKLYRHKKRKSVISQWTEIKWTIKD